MIRLQGKVKGRLWSYEGAADGGKHQYKIDLRSGDEFPILVVPQELHDRIQAVEFWETCLVTVDVEAITGLEFHRRDPALEAIRSIKFWVNYGILSSMSQAYALLQEDERVIAVRDALHNGDLTEEDIRSFIVQDLMFDFNPQYEHAFDWTHAALAVALETEESDFAKEFIHDLANGTNGYIFSAANVAKEILKNAEKQQAAQAPLQETDEGTLQDQGDEVGAT
jgi:hypothetical protein